MSPEEGRLELVKVRQMEAIERQRAVRAAALAERYALRSNLVPQQASQWLARLTEVHRRTAERHRASATIHELHAARIEAWLAASGTRDRRPAFVAAVAEALGTGSAIATLQGRSRVALAVASSDPIARAAYGLEITLGEGPVAEAATGATVTVTGDGLCSRWPRYGPALTDLGVTAVSATPLGLPEIVLGTLCAYNTEPVPPRDLGLAVASVADALTHSVLLADGDLSADAQLDALRLFDEADYRAHVHQAAGMVSVQCGCSIDDAMDLLVARSFATDMPVEDIALQLIRGQTRLY